MTMTQLNVTSLPQTKRVQWQGPEDLHVSRVPVINSNNCSMKRIGARYLRHGRDASSWQGNLPHAKFSFKFRLFFTDNLRQRTWVFFLGSVDRRFIQTHVLYRDRQLIRKLSNAKAAVTSLTLRPRSLL